MELWYAVLPGLYLPWAVNFCTPYISFILTSKMQQVSLTWQCEITAFALVWPGFGWAACSCLWSVVHIKNEHHPALRIAENLSVWWMHEYFSDCLSVKYIEISQLNKGHFPNQFSDSVKLDANKSFAIWMSFNQPLMESFSLCWSY